MGAMATALGDVDAELCNTLKIGAPTGVREPIPPSGVFPPLENPDLSSLPPEALDLHFCEGNHLSAEQDLAATQKLIQAEIDKGFMEHVVGGEVAVRQRFPPGRLAVGKLGIVRAEGREDRLIGDSRASGASPLARFCERCEVPSLRHFGIALQRSGCFNSDEWALFSIDIKGAHKSIRTAAEDVGYSVFRVGDEFFAYLVNHFGSSWSAYWWGRLSSLLMRITHHVLRHRHIAGVYVDDFLFVLPRNACVPLASLVIALFQILNVPISWGKLNFGNELKYVGWELKLESGFWAKLPDGKLQKIMGSLKWWILHPRRVHRDELQRFLGLLVWASQVNILLRPFLAPLFRICCGRSQKMQCLGWPQLEELVGLLDENLESTAAARLSDVQRGWRLVALGSNSCSCLAVMKNLLRQPKIKNDRIWARFSAWGPTVTLGRVQLAALRLLQRELSGKLFEVVRGGVPLIGTADAWADSKRAGLGGWFNDMAGNLKWFHIELLLSEIPPEWEWPQTMQRGISALELLAQQILVQVRGGPSCKIVLRQFCDNFGAVGSLAKGICTKFPLGAALMNAALVCLDLGYEMEVTHLAGERNEDADALSRLNCATAPDRIHSADFKQKFHEQNRVKISVEEVFRPWKSFLSGPSA